MNVAADAQQRQLENEAAANLVRSRDRERYWCALFAPASDRPGLLALYAFDAELAHIAAAVREPMAGQIRLQWWRDAIDLAAPDTKTGNPVADTLAAAIVEYNLPKERLIRMVDGRIPEVFGDPPAGMQALHLSLRECEGAVFELAACILGDRSVAAGKAAEHAGHAWGLTQRLRTIPLQASRRRLLLPPSYFEGRGADLAELYAGRATPAIGAALADLRGEANRALRRFRELAPELNSRAWPAFLPLALVKPYLKATAASSLDPLQNVVTLNPVRCFSRIWRAARRGAI
ncbi:MAG: squalene/phytoene synthase family protein [Rhodomicrobium sp.]